MSRLVVHPGTPQAWEINLNPGVNSFGRGEANHFKINDPSVSGSHCQIVVNENRVVLQDNGSTNGTFVGGAQVQERQLENGQAVRLGHVEMIFYADVAAAGPAKINCAARPVVKLSDIMAPPAGIPPVAAPVGTGGDTEIIAGTRYCKYHPKSPAQYLCPKCQRTYCGMCINTSEIGGRASRSCRGCGEEVAPFQFRLPPPKNFSSKLPGAFSYPFKGAGILVMLFATIAFSALNFISGGIFGIFIKISLYGFVFLFMQNIILSTTSDEKEALGFPDPSGLFGAAFQLAGVAIASFWPVIALEIAKIEGVDIPVEAIIAAVILGGIYFPMAFLAVAMKDSVMAANPLVVIPAMFKVPGKYSVTAILTLIVFGIRQLGAVMSGVEGSVSLMTRNVNTFMVAAAVQMVWAVLSVYLLCVTMRILGLFYNSSKQQLGWYNY
jgi:hypothetical protein